MKRACLLAAVLLTVGCFKKSDDAAADAGASTGAADASAPAATSTVATFPDMIPQSGTRRVLQPIIVRQAPDPNAPMLTKLSPGQLVDLKGSRGAWMLIMWPSGVGQLSPGWVDLAINDPRAVNVVPDAGAPAAPAAASATAAASIPIIRRLPQPKKK